MYSLDNYFVMDLETTIRSPISSPAHPMWPDNKIVKFGFIYRSPSIKCDSVSKNYITPDGEDTGTSAFGGVIKATTTDRPIVGHNLKFDLLYVLKSSWLTPSELSSLTIWDTQHVEYLLSAQTHTYASLDDLSMKYGGTKKDDRIKEFWDNGVPTEKIPEKMLEEYLKHDLSNTELVYLKQYQKVVEYGMLPLVESQMRALVAATLMEYNGMCVNREFVERSIEKLEKGIKSQEAALASYVAAHIPLDYGEWQWSSNKDVSTLLFGGTYKVKEIVIVGRYKNGKDKYKTGYKEVPFVGLSVFKPETYGALKNKLGYYTVDDRVLASVGGTICDTILELRKLSKQKETYFENLKGLMFPSNRVHPNINMCSTKTGRLSCNKPNLQNQTNEGGIKEAYISRWGAEGRIVEFDYKQLEMAGLAILSKDEQLMYDINNGVDMHTELYKSMYGRAPSKEERKRFKRLSFGLIYGAGANTLSEQAGCSVTEAMTFIDVFYKRYPGVRSYHESQLENARKGRKLLKEHSDKGLPIGAYLQRLPTGRMFLFKEYDNEWKGGVSFSPTELKNWPVQGFSTGDIVPHMVGELVSMLYRSSLGGLVRPMMTVHDSLEFDVHVNVLDKFIAGCGKVLKNTSKIFGEHFGIDIPVKLDVECSVGTSWGNVTERKL